MHEDLKALSRRLAQHADAVCAHYLSNGKREGHYWMIGDVLGNPGRSMHVRLTSSTHGHTAGRWTDHATGEHGDLLDLIQANQQLPSVIDAKREALRFLSEPIEPHRLQQPSPRNPTIAAQRLFHASKPITGTHGADYLRARSITCPLDLKALRFHPGCYYRPHRDHPLETFPAIISAITDLAGGITGVHRTYLDPARPSKLAVETPKLSMGHILGHAIRFGTATDVLAAGEGLETVLSVRTLLPHLPMVAATSAGHLGALLLPASLKRLYIILDNNKAGRAAADRLLFRCIDTPVEARLLVPVFDDWNTDLKSRGMHGALLTLLPQLDPLDRP